MSGNSAQRNYDYCSSSLATPSQLIAQHTRQLLLTPGFVTSSQYANNIDCYYNISTAQQHRVVLDISTSVLEDRLFTDCADYIRAHFNDILAAEWCGVNHPEVIISPANTLTLHFHSDAAYGLQGANMSYVNYAVPGCPPDWIVQAGMCYRLFTRLRRSFLDAQRQCQLSQSNLLMLTDQAHKMQVIEAFGAQLSQLSMYEAPWMGFTDSADEGTLIGIDGQDVSTYNTVANGSKDQTADRDCVYLLDNDAIYTYASDDCRQRRTFICAQSFDASTMPIAVDAALIDQIRRGEQLPSYQWSAISLLIPLVTFILLLIICLLGCCVAKWNKRATKRKRTSIDPLVHASTDHIEHATPVAHDNRLFSANDNVSRDEIMIANATTNTNTVYNIHTVEEDQPQHREMRRDSHVSRLLSSKSRPNEKLSHRSAQTHSTSVAQFTLPPIDRFDHSSFVRALDNQSALSMDEFWNNKSPKTAHLNQAKTML